MFNLYKNAVFQAQLRSLNSLAPSQVYTTIFGVTYNSGDRAQIKCVPSDGGGTGSISMSGVLTIIP